MRIRVLYFASLRDRMDGDVADEEVPAGSSVRDLRTVLAARSGLSSEWLDKIRAAVNQEFAGDEHRLRDGDELAWIPAVSGGSHVD